MQTWNEWQIEVLSLLNHFLEGLLEQVFIADVDWPAWRAFFLEGRSPLAAVSRALERDL